MSKIEGDKSCLCYLTTAENLRAANSSIRELERQFLYKNRRIKEIFEQAEFIYEEPLAISQISFSKKSQVEDHVLMLGDAAGMITPLCGNGMSMAMHASKIAFTNVNAYLQNQISRREMEAKYKSEWAKQFSGRLFIGRTVQYLFGGNTTTSVFINGMSRLPSLSKRIIAATHGQSF
jgi:flavin-dependent dehydrogenase